MRDADDALASDAQLQRSVLNLRPRQVDQSAPRSLKHEYDLYVENEIEAYKESISRSTLLKIGDEAVAALQSAMQISMNELLLVVEVDKIIRKRLRLPSYATWRKHELKRRKEHEEFMDYVRFRDYLRTHPEDARAYGELKLALAGEFLDDRAGYQEAKAPYVARLVAALRRG